MKLTIPLPLRGLCPCPPHSPAPSEVDTSSVVSEQNIKIVFAFSKEKKEEENTLPSMHTFGTGN